MNDSSLTIKSFALQHFNDSYLRYLYILDNRKNVHLRHFINMKKNNRIKI